MRFPLVLAASLLAAAPLSADRFGDCSHSAPRRVSAPAAGVTRVVVIGKAGSLKVSGRQGAADIVANGTACSSDAGDLPRIVLESKRSGSDLRIEAVIPEGMFFSLASARLDFEVVVPSNLPLVVTDGSGSVLVENVAAASITDGSGEIEVRGVAGNVTVTDGSGSLSVDNVGGEVRITDGSGSIDIRRTGAVVIEADGSGSIDIATIARSVTIEDDGSGSVQVADVRGDFSLLEKGSGTVDYDRIGGRVRVNKR